MFGVGTHELLLVAVLALLFIGPKELPTAMRMVGRWIGKVRGMARQFTSGFEEVIREAELEELERKWREENDRIMSEYPALPPVETPPGPPDDEPGLPLPLPDERRELP
jgi:sec-independent protein translocase protein TatB